MKDLKIVFFGTPKFVTPIIDHLSEHFNLVAVVTGPDQKVGRKQLVTPSPAKEHVLEANLGVEVFTPIKISSKGADSSLIEKLQTLEPDLIVVAAYGKIIPNSVLKLAKYGAINVHPSLLPKYRGVSPIQTSILNGDKMTGLSIILMDEQMDHGPIIYQEEYELSQQATFDSLSKEMFYRAAQVLIKLIPQFVKGEIIAEEQDHTQATFCKMLKRETGYFDIETPPPPDLLSKMLRAYYPWPNVWTKWNNKVIKLYPQGLVQIEGKKSIPLKDFLNGYPTFPLKSI